MNFTPEISALANRLRRQIVKETDTVDEGESVAMMLLWTFLLDHARCHDLDPAWLARNQLESFITHALKHIQYVHD